VILEAMHLTAPAFEEAISIIAAAGIKCTWRKMSGQLMPAVS
jgi:hypothetical protein